MTAPELKTFHVGIVVRDIEKTMAEFSALFDIDRWFRSSWRFNGAEFAYGLGAGQSIELFQVMAPGDSHIHQHYNLHGEGVNHIGIWTSDVSASVIKARDAG